MLGVETKRKIDGARDVLVGKIPNPQAQVEQITTALIYKFMDDMDDKSKTLGGKARFFVGDYEKYSWRTLLDPRIGGQERMNLYSEAVQKLSQNPTLPQIFRDVFKDAFVPYRDPETLSLFLKEINWFDYHHSEELGNAYEYLLSIMGSQGDAGQFRTPRHIIDFIVEAVDPQKSETVLDPACGTAGFLISAYKHILGANDGLDDITGLPTDKESRLNPEERAKMLKNFTGYDISPEMVRLSLVNMYLHGFVQPRIEEYDSLTYEDHWQDDYDVILANPPFMTPTGGVRPHKKFRIQANKAEVLFVDYIAEHLKPEGRAGIVVPEGIIFQGTGAYTALRKMLIEEQGLWAVVSLPAGVFQPYSGVKTSILLLDKSRAKNLQDILFVDVKQDGTALGASRRATDKNDLPSALEIINQWKLGQRVESSLASYVPKVSISDNSYDLSPSRYKQEKIFSGKFKYIALSELIKQEKTRAKDKILPVWSVSNSLGFVRDGSQFTHKISSEDTSNYKVVKRGFFAYNPSRINVGSIALNNDGDIGIVSPMYEVFSVDDGRVNPRYLFNLLKSNAFGDYVKENARGGVRQQLKYTDLEKLRIPLPSLTEQNMIVDELEGYQKIIDGANQIIKNWKPQIIIDNLWPTVELGEIGEFKNGLNFSKDSMGESIKVIGVSHFQDNLVAPVADLPEVKVGSILNDSYLLKEGDLLFVRSNGNQKLVGRSIIIPEVNDRISFSGFTIRYRLKEGINPLFYAWLFKSEMHRNLLKDVGRGANIRNLSQEILKAVKVPLPPLEAQNQALAIVENEQTMVASSKSLVKIYKQRVEDKIAEVWGE